MEQTSLFEENDIVNREYYEGIKDIIKCGICLDIVKEPVQCSKCQHYFCSQCSKQLKNCPFRCENSSIIPSFTCNQLLSGLKIKCKCGNEIGYDFLRKHKEKDCKKENNVDYMEKYLNLKKEYDLLVQGRYKINDDKYWIKSSVHTHPIECNKRFLRSWNCSNCKKSFSDNVPSYHCTLCNFDLCYYCAKNTVTEGTVLDEMMEFYLNKSKNEPDANSSMTSSIVSNYGHDASFEYSKGLTSQFTYVLNIDNQNFCSNNGERWVCRRENFRDWQPDSRAELDIRRNYIFNRRLPEGKQAYLFINNGRFYTFNKEGNLVVGNEIYHKTLLDIIKENKENVDYY